MDDAGVYMIRNRKTGAFYIGASTQLRQRLRTQLSKILNRQGEKYCAPFGGAFLGCSESDVELRVIERLPQCDVRHREIHWIRALKPTLNTKWTRGPIDIDLLPVGIASK